MALGIIGIIIALLLFIFLVYKGWKNLYVSLIAVAIVCITNKMDFIEQLTSGWLTGVITMITTVFSVIFLGTIFGRIYSQTGGSYAIAKWLCKTFIDGKDEKKKVTAAVVSYFIISSLVIIGGIDCFAAFFSLFPICVIMAQKANIPRRFLPGMLYLNCAFFACPGVPIIYNIITQAAFASAGYEFSVWGGLIPGLVATAIIGVGSIVTLTTLIRKAQAKGEVFEYGEVEHYQLREDRPLPHPIIAILPLVCVFVLYSVVGLDIFYAMTGGIVLDLILMGKYLTYSEESEGIKRVSFLPSLKKAANEGAGQFPSAIFDISCANGLATVITATAAFGAIVGALGGLNMPPIWLAIVVVCVIVAITSSPPTAIMIGVPIIVGICASKGIDMNVGAIGRVVAIAAGTFETLPINGAILTTMALSKVTHKEGYFPEFMESIVFMLVGCVVAAVLFIICPAF